jgi:hypothetical protein
MKKYLIVPFFGEPFWTEFSPKSPALQEYVHEDFQAFLWEGDQFLIWNGEDGIWEPLRSDGGLVQMTLVQMTDNA